MTIRYTRIAAAVASVPWALQAERLVEVQAALAYLLKGGRLSEEEIQAIVGERMESLRILSDDKGPQAANGGAATAGGQAIAVLGLKGLVSHRIEQVEDISGPGGTSTERFGQRFRSALNNPEIGGILLDVNSPGGNVHGVRELADEIFAARQNDKPVVAVANATAASAAFWIAAAADELVVTPSGEVGSIGVFTLHQDLSDAFAMEGIKNTLISAGKFKTEGNPFEPLSEESRDAIQARVDDTFGEFVDAVARSRAVKSKQVREGFGQGRTVGARAALREGMVDRVATFDQEVARMRGRMGRRRRGASGGRQASGSGVLVSVGNAAELLLPSGGGGLGDSGPICIGGGGDGTSRDDTDGAAKARELDLIEAEIDLA